MRRGGRGRPHLRPRRVVGDKGYTGRRSRASCRRRGLRSTIARLRTEHRTGPLGHAVYRLRARAACLSNRCKQYRSRATRYDKRAASYRAVDDSDDSPVGQSRPLSAPPRCQAPPLLLPTYASDSRA